MSSGDTFKVHVTVWLVVCCLLSLDLLFSSAFVVFE